MNMTSPVQERRLNMRLMGYWQELRQAAGCPAVVSFDPALLADVWDNCFQLDLSQQPGAPRFQHIGDILAKDAALDVSCATTADLPQGNLLAKVLERLSAFEDGLQPIVDSGVHQDGAGRSCLYRSIMLPFTGESGDLRLVVGGARSRPAALDND